MSKRLLQVLFAKAVLTVLMTFWMLFFSPLVLGHGEETKMEDYQVKVETSPAEVLAGESFTLTLRISNSADSKPVTEFDEVHTKLLHLIVVSEDLTEFLHLHPDYQGDGVFVLENVDFPKEAHYTLFADFTPTGDDQQVIRLALPTANAQTSKPELVTGNQEDRIDELRFQLDIPDALKMNEETALRFHITNVATGKPVNTLEEYLGAAGHLVIIDESGKTYLHTHPAEHDMAGMAGMHMKTSYGPDIEFMTEFPATGLYALWLQVQYEGEIYTAPFVIHVTREATATHKAHQH